MLDIQGVDYIRIPAKDISASKDFYGRILGLPDGPSQHEDWVEYQAGNVTLAVMSPETHDEEFVQLAPATFALRVPDVAEAKARLEAEGVTVGKVWDSGVCNGARVTDPAGNQIQLHHRYKPHGES